MRAPRLAILRLIRQEQPTSKLSYRGKLWAEGAQNWRPHTFWPKLYGGFWRCRPQNIWQTDERRMVVARKWCNNSGDTEEVCLSWVWPCCSLWAFAACQWFWWLGQFRCLSTHWVWKSLVGHQPDQSGRTPSWAGVRHRDPGPWSSWKPMPLCQVLNMK